MLICLRPEGEKQLSRHREKKVRNPINNEILKKRIQKHLLLHIQCSCTSEYSFSALPNPSTGSYVIALFDFCNPNVTKFCGCQGYFRQQSNSRLSTIYGNCFKNQNTTSWKGRGLERAGLWKKWHSQMCVSFIREIHKTYFILSLVFCLKNLKDTFQNIVDISQ